MVRIICKFCQAPAYTVRKRSLFCSDKCRDAWHRVEKQVKFADGIPQSGIPGVSFCTKTEMWKIRHVKLYITMVKALNDAVEIQERHLSLMYTKGIGPEAAKEQVLQEIKEGKINHKESKEK